MQQFQLGFGNQQVVCTAHEEKSVDVLKYSRASKSYYHVGPVQTKLSIAVEVSGEQISGIRDMTITSNVRESKSKLLPDISNNSNGVKRKRDKSPPLAQKRAKTDQRSSSRSPKQVPVSNSSRSPSLQNTSISDTQVPKKIRRSPEEEKILNELNIITINKLTEDKVLSGIQLERKIDSFTNTFSIKSPKEYETIEKEYNSLFRDYESIYKAFQNNQLQFDHLFKLYDRASDSIKEEVENKIKVLHKARSLDREKLETRYNSIEKQLTHLKDLLNNFSL